MDELKTLALWWAGWTVLDWIWKYFLGAALVTLSGWLIARYRASPVQHEIRGAVIALTIMTVLTMALALNRRPAVEAIFGSTPPKMPSASVASSTNGELDALRSRNSTLQNQVNSLTKQLSQPTPSPVPPPHQITPQQALDFINGFRTLRGKSPITITAAPDNEEFKNELLLFFTFPYRLVQGVFKLDNAYLSFNPNPAQLITGFGQPAPWPRFAGFEIIPVLPSPTPKPEVDVDATPSPTPSPIPFPSQGVVIHAPDGSINAAALKDLLGNTLKLNVSRGYKYPPDANPSKEPDLIYIQIGSGSPWR